VIKAKPFDIPKRQIWEAFKRVKANHGAAGVDGQSIEKFEVRLADNPTNSGIGCRRAAICGRRCAAWTSRRRMAERGRWAYQRSLIASPKKLSAVT
jgi:hypothetical protein